tara:strand:+ start:846 stop:1607 length:762 start_codon:yes stop_codon:yes gene_type:complete
MYNEQDVTKDLVAEQVQAQLKALGISGDEDARKPEPVKINLGGQEYTFNSHEEMSTAINNTFAAVSQQQAAVLAQLEEANSKQNSGDNSNLPGFDQEKFVKLITEDPIAAFNYVDEMRYGPDRLPPKVKSELAEMESMKGQLTAYRFMNAHPEFHNDDKNAAQLRGIAQSLGLPMDYNGLESAYRVGRANGISFQAPEDQTQGRFNQQSNNVHSSTPTPPSINRGGNNLPEADVEAYMNGLSNEQLRALLERG